MCATFYSGSEAIIGGTYRSGPLLSGTDTLALYCSGGGDGCGGGSWHWAGAFNHKMSS